MSTISREKFIEEITKAIKTHGTGVFKAGLVCAKEIAQSLPPAEAEWIPVSDGLPEDGVDVLITTENEEIYIDQVITDPYKERYFQSNTGYDNFQVIAWMPLPKPYKAESEVEE